MGVQAVVTATLVTNRENSVTSIPEVTNTDGFTVIRTDQRQSSSSSIQIINGKASQKTEIYHQFYYYISPSKTGHFKFPSLEIIMDGKSYRTESIEFTVQNETVSNPDIKVMLHLNKRNLYVGEQAILTFKVAQKSQSPTEVRNGFMPALEKLENALGSNFSISKLFTNQITTTQERIDGEIFNIYSLRYAVYPVNSGTFNIPPIPFGYQELRRVRSRRSDPFFDDFFDMNSFFGNGVQAVDKNAISNKTIISVNTFPSVPVGFTGSVGKFSVAADINISEIPAGEAVTLKVLLKGSTRPASVGDIKLPPIENCEVFKPEQQFVSDTSVNGISTRKSYKYLLIPKQEGKLVIPPVSFIYFDPESATFKTASSDTIIVNVTKGKQTPSQQNRYLTQEEIREIGKDIRYIKTGAKIKNQLERPYQSPIFYALFPIPFIIFILSLLYKFQSSKQKRNASLIIRRKALSSAHKNLSKIKKQVNNISSSEFLGRVSETIERFISQKFGFAATGRTLDELKSELLLRNADEKTVAEFASFIEHLDGYRFGGLTLNETAKTDVLQKISVFLNGLEKSSKKGGNFVTHALIAFIGSLLIFSSAYSAPIENWFEKANQFYMNEHFDSAAVYYEKIIDAGILNSSVLYNLGNTCFRQKKLGLSRYFYEKALKLNPKDPDISVNIRYLKANIIDKVPDQENGFIDSLVEQLHLFFPLNTQLWILFGLLLSISILLSSCLYISGNKKLWFIYFSALLSLFLVINGISAGVKINQLENISYAILLSPVAEARNEPDGNKILFSIHEGTKIRIRKTNGAWSLISLPNGVSGWIESKDIGRI